MCRKNKSDFREKTRLTIQDARYATLDPESLADPTDTRLQDVCNPARSVGYHMQHMVLYVVRMGCGASCGFFATLEEAELFISGPALRILNGSLISSRDFSNALRAKRVAGKKSPTVRDN